eukprot:TRINITY_DN2368_c0_g2_i1.p2 TRINITY_DN2368_c0_g2~~TRINITY_DN2368_c0_g2_i1.p2  ORF type:complete len:498 (+),score=60.04 TRINITY_DN2368_c0_g2_i1:7149-8642(+)
MGGDTVGANYIFDQVPEAVLVKQPIVQFTIEDVLMGLHKIMPGSSDSDIARQMAGRINRSFAYPEAKRYILSVDRSDNVPFNKWETQNERAKKIQNRKNSPNYKPTIIEWNGEPIDFDEIWCNRALRTKFITHIVYQMLPYVVFLNDEQEVILSGLFPECMYAKAGEVAEWKTSKELSTGFSGLPYPFGETDTAIHHWLAKYSNDSVEVNCADSDSIFNIVRNFKIRSLGANNRQIFNTYSKKQDVQRWIDINALHAGLTRLVASDYPNFDTLEEKPDVQWRVDALLAMLDLRGNDFIQGQVFNGVSWASIMPRFIQHIKDIGPVINLRHEPDSSIMIRVDYEKAMALYERCIPVIGAKAKQMKKANNAKPFQIPTLKEYDALRASGAASALKNIPKCAVTQGIFAANMYRLRWWLCYCYNAHLGLYPNPTDTKGSYSLHGWELGTEQKSCTTSQNVHPTAITNYIHIGNVRLREKRRAEEEVHDFSEEPAKQLRLQ